MWAYSLLVDPPYATSTFIGLSLGLPWGLCVCVYFSWPFLLAARAHLSLSVGGFGKPTVHGLTAYLLTPPIDIPKQQKLKVNK